MVTKAESTEAESTPKPKRTRSAASCKAAQDGYACNLVPNHPGAHVDMARMVMWTPGPIDVKPLTA
jgi:hypothetical protein